MFDKRFIAKVQTAFETLALKLKEMGNNVRFINVKTQSIDDICDILIPMSKQKS